MLKTCSVPANSNKFHNTKCAEVICRAESSFTIVCVICRMKLFDFEDFVVHFRNVHLDEAPLSDHQPQPILKVEQEGLDEVGETHDELEQPKERTECCNLKAAAVEFSHCSDTEDATNNWKVLEDDDWQPEIDTESELSEEPEGKFISNEETSGEKKTPTQKLHKCEYCDKKYANANGVKVHIKMKHFKEHKCEKCNEAFAEERALQMHMQRAHIGFRCVECNKVYKSAGALKVHSYIHKDVKDFVCDYVDCGKAFVSQRRLTVHKEVHTGIRNYVCEICGYRSRLKDALIVHKRSHTGEKPFECKICGRRFYSSSLLKEHQPMHSHERPHKCDVCEATFSRPKALYHHKHLHLAVKKFVCKLCDKAYAQAAGLSGHMRKHRN